MQECFGAACMYAIRTPGLLAGIRQSAAATHLLD
jgi:hypothetical protein